MKRERGRQREKERGRGKEETRKGGKEENGEAASYIRKRISGGKRGEVFHS